MYAIENRCDVYNRDDHNNDDYVAGNYYSYSISRRRTEAEARITKGNAFRVNSV